MTSRTSHTACVANEARVDGEDAAYLDLDTAVAGGDSLRADKKRHLLQEMLTPNKRNLPTKFVARTTRDSFLMCTVQRDEQRGPTQLLHARLTSRPLFYWDPFTGLTHLKQMQSDRWDSL